MRHPQIMAALAACSLALAYCAWASPHPLHPWLALALTWAGAEVLRDLWNRENRP